MFWLSLQTCLNVNYPVMGEYEWMENGSPGGISEVGQYIVLWVATISLLGRAICRLFHEYPITGYNKGSKNMINKREFAFH